MNIRLHQATADIASNSTWTNIGDPIDVSRYPAISARFYSTQAVTARVLQGSQTAAATYAYDHSSSVASVAAATVGADSILDTVGAEYAQMQIYNASGTASNVRATLNGLQEGI